MTQLFLVRHGPTHAKGMVGWTDLPADLSDRAALARLSAALPAAAPVIASTLRRARDTAAAIAGARPRLPASPALREMHFGDWEMRRADEVEQESPELLRAFYERPGDVRPPRGESWDDLRARVDPEIDRLCDAHAGGAVIVVAHFGVILSQLQRALGCDTTTVFGHRLEPLSLTQLVRESDSWRCTAINQRP